MLTLALNLKNDINSLLKKAMVVDLFTNMDMGDTEGSKDLLGRTYEYCIQQFAAYEGVKGGEFYIQIKCVN